MLNDIYNALKDNPFISSKVNNRIKFYEYPDSSDLQYGPYIIVDPLGTPTPDDYGDNHWLTQDNMFQVEVWAKNPMDKQEIAEQIQLIMWDVLGFYNSGSGIDEYEDGVYRDARRYRGKQYVI